MVTFPIKEIEEVNNLLHQLLGQDIVSVLNTSFLGEGFLIQNHQNLTKDQSLKLIQQLSDDQYLELYRILNFYYPRWIAFNCIQNSNDYFKEYSSNNELLLALTSIIDRLANATNKTMGWTKRFKDFLTANLTQADIAALLNGPYLYKNGVRITISTLNEFSEYIYEVRSIVIHNAELTGIYPYTISFDLYSQNSSVINTNAIYAMVQPSDFRRLLWKSIFNSLSIKLID